MTQIFLGSKYKGFKLNGNINAGGFVYFYEADGTFTTPKNTYNNSDLGTPNANPVVLDSAGEADIWLSGNYDIIVKDAAGVTLDTITNYNIESSSIVLRKSTSYTITNADNNRIILSTGTTTISLPAISTLSAGFRITVLNIDTVNTSTIGRIDTSNIINGTAANISLPPETGITITVDDDQSEFFSFGEPTIRGDNGWTGNQTFTGDQTFTGLNTFSNIADSIAPITIKTTSDTANAGPLLNLIRSSASPAINDILAKIRWVGKDDTDTDTNYAGMYAEIIDPTDTTEDGRIGWETIIAGSVGARLYLGNGLYTPNATGGDKGADAINVSAIYDDNERLLAGNILLRDVTPTQVTNSTTETPVFSDTVTGGQLGTNRKLRVTLIGRAYDNNAGTSQLAVRVKYGGTTFSENIFTHTGTSTNYGPLFVQTEIAALNSATEQVSANYGLMGVQAAAGADSAPAFRCSGNGSGAVNSAVDQTLQITFQHTTAHANVTATASTVHVELI